MKVRARLALRRVTSPPALPALATAALLTSLAACNGVISGERLAAGSVSGGSAGAFGTSMAGAAAGGPAGVAGAAQVAPDPGSVVLHRLNRAEYNNTVRALLGTTRTPADAFPPDGASGGFDNNASALTLSTTELRLMESAAEALAAEAADPNGTTLQR